MSYTLDSQIACAPFPKSGIEEAKSATGISFIANVVKLVGLKVVVGNDRIPAGKVVYVSGRDYTTPWAKAVYQLNGTDVIMVPIGSVLVVAEG